MLRYFPFLFFLAVSSCRNRVSSSSAPISASDLGALVAKVGDNPIYEKQVLAVAKIKAISNQKALETLIDLQLLATLARKDHTHLVADKDLLVQRLLDRDFEPSHLPASIPEKDLKRLYERAIDAYVHPRLVDIALLAFYTGSRMKEEPVKKRRQAAHELQAHLKKYPPKTLQAFSAIASEPLWKEKQLVFQRFLQGPDKPLSSVVGKEVIKLRSEGEMTPLIEDENGLFVAFYVGEKTPRNIPFAAVREELRSSYYERWRIEQFLDFTRAMMQLHTIEIFPGNLPSYPKGS